MSFGKGTFIIVEECEDVTVKEAKSILGRQVGYNDLARVILEQSALK